jgi:hypothetical protein
MERNRRACAPDFHVVARLPRHERVERETGVDIPGTKGHIEFVYRIEPPTRTNRDGRKR